MKFRDGDRVRVVRGASTKKKDMIGMTGAVGHARDTNYGWMYNLIGDKRLRSVIWFEHQLELVKNFNEEVF